MESDQSHYLTSWTETGSNKLTAYKLVTGGLDIKLNINGNNFKELFEAVATHARTMRMTSLFEHGRESTFSSLVYALKTDKSPSLNLMELHQWMTFNIYPN